ncbi:MAG: aspartate/glutamate racemase family protein, partial [Chloroflexota bacterium]
RVIERLRTLASFAEESGAQAVLLTCTAFGRLVDDVRGAVSCPVLSVLDIMVDEALKLSGTIGVLASHPGTLAGASHVLEEEASHEGKPITVRTRHCPGAFDAMWRDDWATHNQIVLANLRELMEEVDVVVAPQPSIERAAAELPATDRKVPVLTSPRLSVLRLKETLGAAS